MDIIHTDDHNGKIGVLICVSLECVATLLFSIIGCILISKRIFKNYFIKNKLLFNPNGFPSHHPNSNSMNGPTNNGYPNPNQPNHFQIEGAGTLPSANLLQNTSPSYPIPSNAPALFYSPPSTDNNVPSPTNLSLPPPSSPLPPSDPPPAFNSSLPPSSYPHSIPPSSYLPGISVSSRERLVWFGKCMVFYLATSENSFTFKVKNYIIYF